MIAAVIATKISPRPRASIIARLDTKFCTTKLKTENMSTTTLAPHPPSHLSQEEANCLKSALACLVLKRRILSHHNEHNNRDSETTTKMPCVTTCKPNLSSLILHKHDHNNNNNSKSNVSSNKKSRTFHHQQEKLKDHIVALIRTAVMLAGKGRRN